MAITVARTLAQVLLLALAVVVFFLGLGVGLAYSSTLGTLLWVAAAGIVGLDLLWVLQSRR